MKVADIYKLWLLRGTWNAIIIAWSNFIVYMIGCNCLIIMAIITLSKVIKHVFSHKYLTSSDYTFGDSLYQKLSKDCHRYKTLQTFLILIR